MSSSNISTSSTPVSASPSPSSSSSSSTSSLSPSPFASSSSSHDAAPPLVSELPQLMEDTVEIGQVVKQGILEKEGHVFKTWKQRWFILTSDGILCYFNVDKDRAGKTGDLLGAIFLNGATIDLQPVSSRGKRSKRPMLVIRTQQGKSFPLKPPPKSPSPDSDIASWAETLSEFATRAYRPPRLVLSPYDPLPPPLGHAPPSFSTHAYLHTDQALAFSRFDVHATSDVHPKTDTHVARYKVESTVSHPGVSSQVLRSKVRHSYGEFVALRQDLAAAFPHQFMPPLTEKNAPAFIRRVAMNPIFQLSPELHEWLELGNTQQRQRKREILQERKEQAKTEEVCIGYTRSGLFSREIAPLYPDPLFGLLQPLSSHLTHMQERLGKARTCFLRSRDHDTGAAKKRADDIKGAMGHLREVNPSFTFLATALGDCLDQACRIQDEASKEVFFENELQEDLRMIEASKDLLDHRRVKLLAYQATIGKANEEKKKLADKITSPELAEPKPNGQSSISLLFRPSNAEIPKQIKLQENRVVESQLLIDVARDSLDQYSTSFATGIRHQEQWMAFDFKQMMETYALQQIRTHERMIDLWRSFLGSTQNYTPDAADPLRDWQQEPPTEPQTAPMTILPLSPIDLREHSSYRQLPTAAEEKAAAKAAQNTPKIVPVPIILDGDDSDHPASSDPLVAAAAPVQSSQSPSQSPSQSSLPPQSPSQSSLPPQSPSQSSPPPAQTSSWVVSSQPSSPAPSKPLSPTSPPPSARDSSAPVSSSSRQNIPQSSTFYNQKNGGPSTNSAIKSPPPVIENEPPASHPTQVIPVVVPEANRSKPIPPVPQKSTSSDLPPSTPSSTASTPSSTSSSFTSSPASSEKVPPPLPPRELTGIPFSSSSSDVFKPTPSAMAIPVLLPSSPDQHASPPAHTDADATHALRATIESELAHQSHSTHLLYAHEDLDAALENWHSLPPHEQLALANSFSQSADGERRRKSFELYQHLSPPADPEAPTAATPSSVPPDVATETFYRWALALYWDTKYQESLALLDRSLAIFPEDSKLLLSRELIEGSILTNNPSTQN